MVVEGAQAELAGTVRWRVLAVCAGDVYVPSHPLPPLQELDPQVRKDTQVVGLPRIAKDQYAQVLPLIQPNILYLFGGYAKETPARDELHETKRQKLETTSEVMVLGSLKVAKEHVDIQARGETDQAPGLPMTIDAAVEMVREYAVTSGLLDCVFLDGQSTDVIGAAIRERVLMPDGSPAVRNVICYPSVPHPSYGPATHFAHAFFGALRTEDLQIHEAYALAVTSTYAHYQRHYHGTVVSGFAPPTVPLLLASRPAGIDPDEPFPALPSAAAMPVDTLADGWEDVQLLGPKVEAKLAILGDRKISAPHRLACIADALRTLLVSEARQLNLAQITPHKAPAGGSGGAGGPAAAPAVATCEVRLGLRGAVQLVVRGPEALVKDAAALTGALRYLLAEEAATMTFKVPPGTASIALMAGGAVPQGSAAVIARRSRTLGMGQKFIEVPLEMPMWCFQAVKFMAADATARDLINLGVVAVSGIPVLSMTPTDATYYAEALRYCTAPIVDVQYVSLQSYPPRPLQPILDAPPERTGPGRRPAATTVDDASIPSGAALLGLGVPRGPPMVGELRYDEAEGLLKRPLMRDCTEEQFMADLGAFWRAKCPKDKRYEVGVFPDAVLNGSKIDLFNLYREVVRRGGFGLGLSLNWKGNIWPTLRNFTAQNKQTAIGHALKRLYQKFLLAYEESHPEDVKSDRCVICGGSEEQAQEFVQCQACFNWTHLACDRRPNLGNPKDYTKEHGKAYSCPGCSENARQAQEAIAAMTAQAQAKKA